MNTIGYFEIQSSQPAREISFYEKLFGWRFIREQFVPIEYYRIETNSINGGLLKRPAESPGKEFSANAFVCSIEVNNIDESLALAISLGAQISIPKFAIPGRCWQVYFTDLDNNSVGLFQPDSNAV
ncbi:MAG: VOC family protein [Bacteroidia bacterium]